MTAGRAAAVLTMASIVGQRGSQRLAGLRSGSIDSRVGVIATGVRGRRDGGHEVVRLRFAQHAQGSGDCRREGEAQHRDESEPGESAQ